MTQGTERSRAVDGDYVQFWSSGQLVKGEFHCSECGYGVTIVRALPLCPMCGGSSWERFPWSPFKRSHQPL
jgi:rubrerythrin